MKKMAILVILLSVYVYGCATTGNKEIVQSDCVPNFTEEGGFWEGKTYQSFKDFSNISKGKAFDKALTAVSANGLQIATSISSTLKCWIETA